eukprot:TRINITY_DN88070_c0_g1_i1.p1 TRINITY_DN88070_c0_g1~~TRINITY_DN88070_c0_g1_i1.p1  ORF type:complete len:309 (-),score=63.30 TRINITY_DN88070_c0_g1_i1:329-1210(-)
MSSAYTDGTAAGTSCHVTSIGGGKGAGRGAALKDRPGSAPSEGFQACQLAVANCTDERCNGLYSPAVPYAGKPVWQKDGDATSNEQFIYYSERAERWYIGDALEEGGFTFVQSPGKSLVPPLQGWQKNATATVAGCGSGSGIKFAAALTELPKLLEISPWEDQELCYVTMLKLLGNIVSHPGEAKFCSVKIENPAIQKKILRFDGARGFFEAIGFCEESGSLVFPTDGSAQAKMASEMLEGFANEAQYNHIRKERHAKAAEVARKEAEKDGWAQARAKASANAASAGGGGGGG